MTSFYERIRKSESRLRAAGLALPAITDSDLDPRRASAPAEPPSGSGMPESADFPVYEMVRTNGTVTDLWHKWSVGYTRAAVHFI